MMDKKYKYLFYSVVLLFVGGVLISRYLESSLNAGLFAGVLVFLISMDIIRAYVFNETLYIPAASFKATESNKTARTVCLAIALFLLILSTQEMILGNLIKA